MMETQTKTTEATTHAQRIKDAQEPEPSLDTLIDVLWRAIDECEAKRLEQERKAA